MSYVMINNENKAVVFRVHEYNESYNIRPRKMMHEVI